MSNSAILVPDTIHLVKRKLNVESKTINTYTN